MKKTTRILSLMLTLVLVIGLACACTGNTKPTTTVAPTGTAGATASPEQATPTPVSAKKTKVMALKGPTGMGMAYLMENAADKYDITLTTMPDDIVAAFASGSVDIAAVPINLASSLYKKLSGEVRLLAVNTLGVLYILENGNTINSLSDLSGKTLYATGQGSTPEYILRYLLEKNNIMGVTIEYKTDHSELATLMAAGEVAIGMLPEPNVTAVTMKNKDVRVAIDLTAEWAKVSSSELAQGCIIASKSFVENNKDSLDKFLADYEASTAFVNNNVDDAAALIEKYTIMASAAAAKAAIPNCHIVCYRGEKMKAVAGGMFTVLFDIEPKSIGGAIPSDEIYYLG